MYLHQPKAFVIQQLQSVLYLSITTHWYQHHGLHKLVSSKHQFHHPPHHQYHIAFSQLQRQFHHLHHHHVHQHHGVQDQHIPQPHHAE